MRPALRLLSCLVPLGLLLAGPARAADTTNEQAAALERQMRDWLAGTLGPDVPLPERPVRFAPEGDRYRLSVPLGGDGGPALTAMARQEAGGTWSVEAIRVPSPARFTLQVPVPIEGSPDKTRPAPVDYIVSVAEQDSSARFDPSYATPSLLTNSFRGLELRARGAGQDQQTRIERYAGTSTLRPVREGRVDVIADATAEGYTATTVLPNGMDLKVEAAKLRSTGELNEVSRERAPQVLQALIRLLGAVTATLPAPGGQVPGGPGADAATLRALLAALQDVASGAQVEQTAEAMRLRVGPFAGSAERFVAGVGAITPGGMLNARMTLGMEGLDLSELPLGPYAALVPRRLLLRPTLSGVATADLMRLAQAASVPGAKAPERELAALFGRGGVTVGLESFALDIGRTAFTGMAALRAPTPDDLTAEGQVSATGFDALIETVKAIPDLASGLPALVFAKGIGRGAGDRLVWDITYRRGQVVVNGVDLAAMAGGQQKAPAQGQRKR